MKRVGFDRDGGGGWAVAVLLLALGCDGRARAPGPDGGHKPSAAPTALTRGRPSDGPKPSGPSEPAEAPSTLRDRAARRCHSGSAQISTAGEAGSRCTVERGCTEVRGKVSPSDGRLTLDCRGLACTCTFEPRRDKAQRKRVQFAIERPCGLSRGARAESLWLEHCFPLLPLATGEPSPE